ncbi:hypothetical protein Dimus_011495 [Dionaea muscipula]
MLNMFRKLRRQEMESSSPAEKVEERPEAMWQGFGVLCDSNLLDLFMSSPFIGGVSSPLTDGAFVPSNDELEDQRSNDHHGRPEVEAVGFGASCDVRMSCRMCMVHVSRFWTCFCC